MIIEIKRTNNEEEKPIVIGPQCFTDKGQTQDTFLTKYNSDTHTYHVATIPFGNYVIDKVICKPDCANIVETGPSPKQCICGKCL